MSKELTTEMLDELRTEITSYFEAYYSALTESYECFNPPRKEAGRV